MRTKLLILLIIAIVLGSIASYGYYIEIYVPQVYSQQSINYYNSQLGMMGYYNRVAGEGMMGGYRMMGSYNGYTSEYSQQISIYQAESYINDVPSYAKLFPSNDTIMFSSNDINIVVLSMGHGRAINLTHYIPPSFAHAQHNVFVIYNLINPTLIIPQGATVHITLINLDAGDYHNLAITPIPPPYPYYAMMSIRMNILGMTPLLPYANYATGNAYSFSFTVTFQHLGTFYYVCEYPGHAEMGMYGEIEVT
ncbi:plastocyanin/azurin family copper-binding protein [Acidianus sp. RZ1]|uniref:plastocyanin/azurin family copper-binding protein n=1 Tax=Acidianus sp. RZ1 TaxID=1540082 RepID=UPI001492F3FB|nr:plastocyanin/azurin family copper-binding protein [Acidianus sp. RZ1]NON61768.1 hypothetical protein [Acidianus sp. RZ1]